MRVERLELIGFKSFAEKTVFKLHPGTTAIVGPNGCGKSNIVDAFKWVLGEQSAKSLRGGSMEDVIFAGSATKKTKGMAEVTLVISDIIKNSSNGSDKEIAGKRTEMSVTRRLYRSGESDYMMNKVRCRLKDIKNMFLDTGLELKAYSILEQGRIGDIINSKPIDRRFLIEEVAGVMKYKIRKNEAQNKLESSKSNLQRLQDIISEVKRQINTIDRHAKKAERYKKLFNEVKDIETRIAKRDFKSFKAEISDLQSSEETLKSKEAEAAVNVHSTEALIEEKKRLCVEHERTLNEIRTNLYSLERETTEDEGKIALLNSDCENLSERQNTLKIQDGERDLKKENTIVSIQELEQNEIELGNELSGLEDVLGEREEGFTVYENEILEMEREIESQRKNLFVKAEDISNIRNEINQISLKIENINSKTVRNSEDISSLNENISSLNTTAAQTKNEYERSLEILKETRGRAVELSDRLKDQKDKLTEKEQVLYTEKVELATMESRLETLQEQDSSQMSSLDDSINRLCQVADIFETPAEYETAIEAVMGDKLAAAVVEGHKEIEKALHHIKEQNIKRSGFITVDSFKNTLPEGTDSEKSFLNKNGVIGEAVKFVSVKEGYKEVKSSLLNDVILVDSLSTAFSLREQSDTDMNIRTSYFVTLEGDVLEPSGMVFGGTDKGVLKIKRLIKGLEKNILAKKEKITEFETTVSTLKEEILLTENNIVSVNGSISSKEKYSHEMEVKMRNQGEENARLNRKHEYISLEINDDSREMDALKIALQEKESGINRLDTEKFEIEEKIKYTGNTISEKRESIEAMRSELTEIKLQLTSRREKMSSLKREIGRLKSEIAEIDRKRQEMLDEEKNIKENIIRKEEEILLKNEELRLKIVEVGKLQGSASEVNDILESQTAELALIEKQQKEVSSELERVRSELSNLEMRKMEQSMKLNYLKEDIFKTYSLEIESMDVTESVEPEEEERLPQLKEKITKMGPVSLGTIDEYEELKTRYEFLTSQRDDLLSSIEDLEETIRKINMTSKKRLQDAFEALNEKFKEVFMLLFGKGKAELQLTEGSILDAGIEIIAQPPGKRLQNLNLLSGGEKAMTALSLLFAGFMIKPTPLCLLDEVDAPLDESNTVRFIKLLKELSKEIQFITITHNRRTMEAAEFIYGITMEEPGSSKTVSMHMSEAV